MSDGTTIDDHFFRAYRALLDAEDAAFDELEHAYEDGDREHWQGDLDAWQAQAGKRVVYLREHGFIATA
ncbi:MAG: hypothetical protein WCI50_13230 [Actinomycetes bacterium]|jgi:hypothetical protein